MPSVERLAIFIEANAGKAIAEFKKVGSAAQGLQGATAGGTQSLAGLGQMGATAGGMLKAGLAGGAVVAAGAIVKFAADAVGATASLAASIRDVQRITGGTAEEASKLVAILDDFEVPVETLNKGFFRLAREIGKNDDAFGKAGFNVAKNAAGNADLSATLLNIADAYNATEDPAKRATLLTAAFGRGGAELIPILEQGRAGIEAVFNEAGAVGQIFSQADLDSAEEYRLAMDDLHDATEQFSLMAGKALIPVLTDITNAVTGLVGGIKAVAGGLGKIGDTKIAGTTLKGIADKFTDIVIPGKLVVGTILDITRHGGPAGDSLKDIADAAEQAAEDAAELTKDVDGLNKALFSVASADRAVTDAHRSLDDAQRNLIEATADYNKLLKDGAVDEEKVADARTSLAEATRSVADANRGVTKAQKEYDEALAVSKILGTDTANDKLAEAAEGLADAQDTQASASERAKDAADDLAKAQAGDPDFQRKLADARQKVADSTQRISDAEYAWKQRVIDSIAAHDAEAKAIDGKAEAVERLITALKDDVLQNPEIASVVNPLIGRLQGSQPGLAGWQPLPAGIAGPPTPIMGAGLGPGVAGPRVPITNNVTINATTSETDARLIAKEVMWNLN